MKLRTAKKASCWKSVAVLAVFLGLQLSRCGQSSELQKILGLGRDFEVLFGCFNMVWVGVGLVVLVTWSLLSPSTARVNFVATDPWLKL